jgi:hypothetical protein
MALVLHLATALPSARGYLGQRATALICRGHREHFLWLDRGRDRHRSQNGVRPNANVPRRYSRGLLRCVRRIRRSNAATHRIA